MRIKTSDGKEILIRIKHSPFVPEDPNNRSTMVELVLNAPNPRVLTASAFCSKHDQFDRSIGRKLAGERMLTILRERGVDKDTRAVIFDHIRRGGTKKKDEREVPPEAPNAD